MRRRGVVLLEVLVAMTLFVIAAAVIGSALHLAVEATARMRRQSKATNLTESIMAELAAGAAALVTTPPTAFADPDGDWTYEVTADDVVGVPGLKRVAVTVKDSDPSNAHVCRLTQWMHDPAAVLTPVEGEEEEPAPVEEAGT